MYRSLQIKQPFSTTNYRGFFLGFFCQVPSMGPGQVGQETTTRRTAFFFARAVQLDFCKEKYLKRERRWDFVREESCVKLYIYIYESYIYIYILYYILYVYLHLLVMEKHLALFGSFFWVKRHKFYTLGRWRHIHAHNMYTPESFRQCTNREHTAWHTYIRKNETVTPGMNPPHVINGKGLNVE